LLFLLHIYIYLYFDRRRQFIILPHILLFLIQIYTKSMVHHLEHVQLTKKGKSAKIKDFWINVIFCRNETHFLFILFFYYTKHKVSYFRYLKFLEIVKTKYYKRSKKFTYLISFRTIFFRLLQLLHSHFLFYYLDSLETLWHREYHTHIHSHLFYIIF